MQAHHSLTLGPVQYNWSPEIWRDFYFRIADEAPVDIVYVGETVCSKRQPFYQSVLPDVIERLSGAGKQVVLSTLAVNSLPREESYLRATAEDCSFPLEANDITALPLLTGQEFVVGPFVNVYNESTASYLQRQGASRVCLPTEISLQSIQKIAQAVDIDIEVQVFGKLPLAVSGRCYHARAHNLHKDNCQYVCEQDPDGMEVRTLDNDNFLTVNGIETLTGGYANLAGDLKSLTSAGVSHFRIWPQQVDMVAITTIWSSLLRNEISEHEAMAKLAEKCQLDQFENGFLHGISGRNYHLATP